MEKGILTEIGLTNNESIIFMTLAQSGPQSASELAKNTGLNRPYIYYALERLLEKGFISKITLDKKTRYQSLSFDQIIFSEQEKIKTIKKIADEIKTLKSKRDETIDLELLKGRFSLKTIFKRAMNELKPNDIVYSIGIDEEKMEEIEPVYLAKILNFSKENNIKENALIKKGSKALDYAKSTSYRFLDSEIIGDTAKIIYQDTVIEIIYGNPIYAIIIKSRGIADSELRKFNVFWKISEKK
ncbi:MarR family transcriptional regulator [Candidatus Pacearchaeota archaeon]|nr:MarR family transcriptional regulator [Candidatus Pacearchaeota archaeon]MBD3283291.1 MarR family transcriptional regulator [Candidatus Pacearchaeota archaeon]